MAWEFRDQGLGGRCELSAVDFPTDAAQPPEQAPQFPLQNFQVETTMCAEARQKINRQRCPQDLGALGPAPRQPHRGHL